MKEIDTEGINLKSGYIVLDGAVIVQMLYPK